MTPSEYTRAIAFNVIYYVGTIIIGIVILPSLILPDRLFWPFIRQYFHLVHWCEKHILGLDYTEVGRENLPHNTPYIIAMKHQSAYETLKLPILFARPVVILKRELLMIPLWGWYAAKAGNIGINRGNARAALDRMLDGVKNAVQMGRTPVIFPQGTRVAPYETAAQKPYRRGIYEMYQTSNVAVVPVAVNSGLFWPRRAFLKRSGCVTFKYLSPIPPGLDRLTFMNLLQEKIETATETLMAEAKNQYNLDIPVPPSVAPATSSKKSIRQILNVTLGLAAGFIMLYTAGWFYGAHKIEKQIETIWKDSAQAQVILTEPRPRLTGFPGRFHLKWNGTILTADVQMSVPQLDVYFSPIFPSSLKIHFKQGFQISGRHMKQAGVPAVVMKSLFLNVQIPKTLPARWTKPEIQALHDQGIVYRLKEFRAVGPMIGDETPVFQGAATLTYDAGLQPQIIMPMVFDNADQMSLIFSGLIKHPMGKSFLTGAIGAMSRVDPATGHKVLPLTLKIEDTKIYIGPFKIGSYGRIYWPVQ